MAHDAGLSWFLFPSMPAADRRIILELGELLADTNGRFREEIHSTIKIMRAAAQSESLCSCDRPRMRGSCRVLPFKRPIHLDKP